MFLKLLLVLFLAHPLASQFTYNYNYNYNYNYSYKYGKNNNKINRNTRQTNLDTHDAPVVFPNEDARPNDRPNTRPTQPNRRPNHRQRPQKQQKVDQQANACPIGNCHSVSDCFPFIHQHKEKDVLTCSLPDGPGVCCLFEVENGNNEDLPNVPSQTNSVKPRRRSQFRISGREIEKAAHAGAERIRNTNKLERTLKKNGLVPRSGSVERTHQDFFGKSPIVIKLANDGLMILQAAIELFKMKNIPEPSGNELENVDITNSVLQDNCPAEPPCPTSKYRTADGSCNNRRRRSWGKANRAFNRMLPPDYADGLNQPRVARDGNELPSARALSVNLAPDQDKDKSSRRYTLALMQFGQFLDHDLTRTASTRTNDNSAILCCDQRFDHDPTLLHPACYPIRIPEDDRFYSQFRQRCINFVRSAPAPNNDCKLGAREQLNQHSAFIDGGMIYGTDQQIADSLRTFFGGRLKTSSINGREFLPMDNSTSSCGIPRNAQLRCFVAGDVRINEQPQLTAMHLAWLREHNRVASTLSQINPGWNDQILYQEAKRIVVAELQHIVFNELLPALLGRQVMNRFGLLLNRNGHVNNYSPDMDSGISAEFATAAYRFHTLVQGMINMESPPKRVVDRLRLEQQFNNPQVLYQNGAYDAIVNGMTGQPSHDGDNAFSPIITNHLFQSGDQPFGLDLVALNIQRGRDHGLRNYNDYRVKCGLSRFQSFPQLEQVTSRAQAEALSRQYKHIDDVDLFVGGVSERPLRGALVGPTFACILGDQFRRLKMGDRFWFENGKLESSFSDDQLKEIRKSSLARIFCDNSDDIEMMQSVAMVQDFRWNPKLSCRSNEIPRMDLTKWRNEPVWA